MKILIALFKCTYILITTMFTIGFFMIYKNPTLPLDEIISVSLILAFGFLYGGSQLYEITKESFSRK